MRASSYFYAYFWGEPGLAAAVAALVPVFDDLVADECTGRRTADVAYGPPENGVAGHAADHSAHAGPDLRP